MKPVWKQEVLEAGLEPGCAYQDDSTGSDADGGERFTAGDLPEIEALAQTQFYSDDSEANGSSIASIAEYNNKRVLFAADAHIPQLLSTLNQHHTGEKAPIDLSKLSHHGSKGTISLEFVEKLDCAKFAFYTNGSLYYHPHREAVARAIHGSGGNPG